MNFIDSYDVSNINNNCNRKEALFFIYLNSLPYEIIDNIKLYIPRIAFITVEKIFYLRNHELLEEMVKTKFESYVRYIVRRDMDLPFSILLTNHLLKWIHFKNYEYKHMVFGNYIHFLQYFCIENESTKCRIKLKNILMNEIGLSKNQHKKNIIKYIKI